MTGINGKLKCRPSCMLSASLYQPCQVCAGGFLRAP
ncbi:rCG43336, partial [Rattus norvegicus]